MKITIYAIEKSEKDSYMTVTEELGKNISRFGEFSCVSLSPKPVLKAQKESPDAAKKSYTETFTKYLGAFNIALDPKGKTVDTEGFSKLLCDRLDIRFFIGGAYGFESAFLKSCQATLSLSQLTMSHKLAKLVLTEQIFRGLSILNNHPYHK